MISSPLDAFITDWIIDENAVKPLFLSIHGFLSELADVSLEYRGRPGISHSVRARHKNQKGRALFVLVDVIDDDSEARWLSICFYADLVSDPEGRGDIIPAGLMGDDACCFDIDSPEGMEKYMLNRLKEAATNAARE